MSLTLGTAPFAPRPRGRFNFTVEAPAHVLYFEDSPRRVRGVVGGETVVDSRRVKLMHETGILPVWYFPEADVRADLLVPSDHHTTCPFKGLASYRSLAAGSRFVENAAWHYPEPIAGAPPIAGHLAFYWDAMDQWLEEDEEVFVHARDPYHRVDVIPTSRHIRVTFAGEVVADTHRAYALFETGLPTRWYIPRDDLRQDLLEPSATSTRCPYKGVASYESVRVGSEFDGDLVWRYEQPLPAVAGIADRLAFFNERVDIDVDGAREVRPQTPWSKRPEPVPRP